MGARWHDARRRVHVRSLGHAPARSRWVNFRRLYGPRKGARCSDGSDEERRTAPERLELISHCHPERAHDKGPAAPSRPALRRCQCPPPPPIHSRVSRPVPRPAGRSRWRSFGKGSRSGRGPLPWGPCPDRRSVSQRAVFPAIVAVGRGRGLRRSDVSAMSAVRGVVYCWPRRSPHDRSESDRPQRRGHREHRDI